MKQRGEYALIKGYTVHYLQFDNIKDFHHFMDTHGLKPINKELWEHTVKRTQHRVNQGSNWYGLPAPKSMEELAHHREFIGMHLLDEARRGLERKLGKFMAFFEENELPQRKIAYNSMGLGVFSFSRASLGLHKVPKPDGGTKLVTSVKEVYAYFERKQVDNKTVRIFVEAGANANIKGEQMLYVGIGMMLLVELFEKMGVGIEINVMLGAKSKNGNHFISITKAKRLEDSLDQNLILLLCADPRYYRFRGLQGINAIYDYFGKHCPKNFGASFDRQVSKKFIESLSEKTSYTYLFQQSYSLDGVEREIERILMDFKQKSQQPTK